MVFFVLFFLLLFLLFMIFWCLFYFSIFEFVYKNAKLNRGAKCGVYRLYRQHEMISLIPYMRFLQGLLEYMLDILSNGFVKQIHKIRKDTCPPLKLNIQWRRSVCSLLASWSYWSPTPRRARPVRPFKSCNCSTCH